MQSAVIREQASSGSIQSSPCRDFITCAFVNVRMPVAKTIRNKQIEYVATETESKGRGGSTRFDCIPGGAASAGVCASTVSLGACSDIVKGVMMNLKYPMENMMN